MRLKQLDLQQFRNYESCHVELSAGLNLIVGPNGSGKTNLLEAAYMACTATSFRTGRDSEIVRWSAGGYTLRGVTEGPDGRHTVTVSYKSGAGKNVQVDGITVSRRSDLLAIAGAVVFAPDDLTLVKGPPVGRRRFIDRLAVYTDRRHASDLADLRILLQQRNSLLYELRAKKTSPTLAGLFDEQFAAVSSRIRLRRFKVLAALLPVLAERLKFIGGNEEVGICYLENGKREYNLSQPAALELQFWTDRSEENLNRWSSEERQRGATLWGPQRDDVLLSLNGRDARQFASQGQQRTLVLALKYAELIFLQRALGSPPVLLLDDVLSELDAVRSRALLELVTEHEQTLLTATDAALTAFGSNKLPAAYFRVSSGKVKEASL